MALISQTIESLKGGVSQQPDTLRLPEQGKAQINGWSSELGGILKRPPVVFKKVLGDESSLGTKPLIHLIDRDESEKYFVCLTGSGLKVFDINGTPKEVRGDMSYVQSKDPMKELKVLTIADYTFIVNTSKVISKDSNKYRPDFNEYTDALINLRGGQYGRKLSIFINGEQYAEYVLPNGSKPEHVLELDAQRIGVKLVELMTEKARGKFTMNVGEGFIHLKAIHPFE